jgi:hypothetical protein
MKNHLYIILSLILCAIIAGISYCQNFKDFGILSAFHERNPDFNHLEILEKRHITPTYSAVVVRAATSDNWYRDMKEGKKFRELYGLLIVSDFGNEKPILLDTFNVKLFYNSRLEIIDLGEDYLTVKGAGAPSKEGLWNAKYFINLDEKKLKKKIKFGNTWIESAIYYDNKLWILACDWRRSILIQLSSPENYCNQNNYNVLEKIDEKSIPVIDRIELVDNRLTLVNDNVKMFIYRDGNWITCHDFSRVKSTSPQDYVIRRSGITVRDDNNDSTFYQIAYQDFELLKKHKPDLEIQPYTTIGCDMKIIPCNVVNNKIWFGNYFYAGEGCEGVGFIGCFDLNSRLYKLYYLDEVVPWSVNTIFADVSNVLARLYHFSEGGTPGQGLLKFEIDAEKATTYPIEELVTTIYGYHNLYFIGCYDAFYILDEESLNKFRFDFDVNENYFIKGIKPF